MENPETLTPALMYSYDQGTNQTWNIPEYKTPRLYADPLLEVQKRKWEGQKKGQPNKQYVTKRGFYMDYPLKVASGIPGSNKHGQNHPWTFEKEAAISKHNKLDPKLLKYTYIDRMEMEQKYRKSPGICTYSLEKSMKQKQAEKEKLKNKKRFIGEKKYFYEDTEYIANGVPGVGNYSPHDEIIKVRKNKTVYKDWVSKHKAETSRDLKRDAIKPAPGTYSPMNCTFTTFDSISQSPNKEKHGFGSDARFTYTRIQKKKIKQLRPGPSSYHTMIQWKGKGDKKRGKTWNEAISKGFETISVYNH